MRTASVLLETKKLLKASFELWVKKRWLKKITIAIDKYQKTQAKANREYYVMSKLIERYNDIYNENLWKIKDK